jgi:hypothetical protein
MSKFDELGVAVLNALRSDQIAVLDEIGRPSCGCGFAGRIHDVTHP